ncbi:hypothetical protein EBR21_17095, partial [bacterium]|nr:hypothetical protein [bacterium]
MPITTRASECEAMRSARVFTSFSSFGACSSTQCTHPMKSDPLPEPPARDRFAAINCGIRSLRFRSRGTTSWALVQSSAIRLLSAAGIFRDLLPLQTKMLAEAAYLAASADESSDMNFIRKHAMQVMAEQNCTLENAALRVFSNADGAYGANVNMMIENGRWDDEDELGAVFSARKSFAHGRDGKASAQSAMMQAVLRGVDLAYQNLESVELGVTTIDHYFDSLGGISRAAEKQRGEAIPVYIGDQTRGTGTVRTLAEQVALESRTRLLNP